MKETYKFCSHCNNTSCNIEYEDSDFEYLLKKYDIVEIRRIIVDIPSMSYYNAIIEYLEMQVNKKIQ